MKSCRIWWGESPSWKFTNDGIMKWCFVVIAFSVDWKNEKYFSKNIFKLLPTLPAAIGRREERKRILEQNCWAQLLIVRSHSSVESRKSRHSMISGDAHMSQRWRRNETRADDRNEILPVNATLHKSLEKFNIYLKYHGSRSDDEKMMKWDDSITSSSGGNTRRVWVHKKVLCFLAWC